jgi:hypothetical protein
MSRRQFGVVSAFDFWRKMFIFLIVERLNISEEDCHERDAVHHRDHSHLVFAPGGHFAEVWRSNLNGSDPSGDG